MNMKIYRSQYFWKKKTWFSDFKVTEPTENIASNRLKHDIKIFMAHTGLVKESVEKMIEETISSDIPKELWKEKFDWTMVDLGELEQEKS